MNSSTLNGSKTTFLYDGDELVAEYNASGALLNRYIHGAGTDDPLVWYTGTSTSNKRYLLANERGSIVSETNATGSVVATHRYGPYGEPINQSASRFRYTGQILIPGTELYHYKARVYHPKLGRFMQTDPIGYEDGMNWYAYGGNDPVNLVDPTGNTAKAIILPKQSGKVFVYPASSHAHAAKRHASGYHGARSGTSENQFKSNLGMSDYKMSATVAAAVVEGGAEYYQPSRGNNVYSFETNVEIGDNGETAVSVATKSFGSLNDTNLKFEVATMLSEAGVDMGPNNVYMNDVEVITTIAPDDGTFKSSDAVKIKEQN